MKSKSNIEIEPISMKIGKSMKAYIKHIKWFEDYTKEKSKEMGIPERLFDKRIHNKK